MSDFSSRHPAVYARLVSMFSPDPRGERSSLADREELKSELIEALSVPDDLHNLSIELWDLASGSWKTFLERSLNAYFFLGVDNEVHVFMGDLWVTLIRNWNENQQQEFILGVLHESGTSINQALEFCSQIFAEIPLSPDFVLTWIRLGSRKIGGQYGPGYSHCVSNFTTHHLSVAFQMLRRWIDSHPTESEHSLIARILNDIRRTDLKGELLGELLEIENLLAQPGNPDFRALLIESWAFDSGSEKLDESQAEKLRALGGFDHDGSEQLAWAFLLACMVKSSPEKWSWAHKELQALAAQPLGVMAKHWLVEAALAGWASANPEDLISRSTWLDFFHTLLPLKKEDDGAFQKFEHILAETFKTNNHEGLELLVAVAASSGRDWIALHESDHTSHSLPSSVRASGQAAELVTNLCLTHSRQARGLGIWLLSKGAADSLSSTLIAAATTSQLELLILEASLRLHEPHSSALIHVDLFSRVDEIGDPIRAMLHEEVRIQALNTHGYREAIRTHGCSHPKLLECVQLAEEEIEEVIRAAESPAVRMQISGRFQAEAVAFRRFSREVQSASEEHSPFNRFFGSPVHILYSRKWRYYNGGILSDISEMTRTEVSTEMPRLEFTRPEDMRMRRIKAAIRIEELQQQPGGGRI